MNDNTTPAPRILIVDDNPSIHEDFRKILGDHSPASSALESLEQNLFGAASTVTLQAHFRIDSAYQGQEALERVTRAQAENDPYSLAFVDVRMPPGWDGIETLERIWQAAPDLQAVICTAYSDYGWDDIARRLKQPDNLLILKKPFETIEVLQMAHALTRKWLLAQQARLRMEDLDRMVRERTLQLEGMNLTLRASEERFSKAFASSPFPFALQRCSDRRLLDVNPSFLALTGHPAELLLNKSDEELALWAKGSEQNPVAFMPSERTRSEACLLRCADKSFRNVLLSVEPISLADAHCQLLVVEDVTERLKLERQLRRAQKMEVIGRMSAGIAHEFNNILTIIQGNVSLVQMMGSPQAEQSRLLQQVIHASQRAAALTRQLLAFSRKQVLQPRSLNLSSLVPRIAKMLQHALGEKYELLVDCRENLPSIFADEGNLEQALTNLVFNARDAMPAGGIIGITTGVAAVNDSASPSNPDARPGDFVTLTVRDHGCGMTPEVLSRIFDPFFTTKEVGKGTGLGLSTIHGIVCQHDGWVDVTSEVGRGSTFKVFLPVSCSADPQDEAPVVEHRDSGFGNGETILVVEDESVVRQLACAALRQRGYITLEAADASQAIQTWENHAAHIDLLLTDMVMPSGMSGGALAKVLQEKCPELKVIYTSGYTPDFASEPLVNIHFLAKPYEVQTLIRTVKNCLNGTAAKKRTGFLTLAAAI